MPPPRAPASVTSVAVWLRLCVRAAHGLRNTQLWGEQQPVVKATLRAGTTSSSTGADELGSDAAGLSVASSVSSSGDGSSPVWDRLDAGATLRLPLGRAREYVGAGRRARRAGRW